MLSKEEIEQARSILLRGNDIESASLILRAMILEGWTEIGGRVDTLKIATVEILDFIEENKNKGNLDYIREKVEANVKIRQLVEDRQKLIEYIEKKRDKLNDEEKEIYKKDIGSNELYRLKIIDEARNVLQEILELVKGEKQSV